MPGDKCEKRVQDGPRNGRRGGILGQSRVSGQREQDECRGESEDHRDRLGRQRAIPAELHDRRVRHGIKPSDGRPVNQVLRAKELREKREPNEKVVGGNPEHQRLGFLLYAIHTPRRFPSPEVR